MDISRSEAYRVLYDSFERAYNSVVWHSDGTVEFRGRQHNLFSNFTTIDEMRMNDGAYYVFDTSCEHDKMNEEELIVDNQCIDSFLKDFHVVE